MEFECVECGGHVSVILVGSDDRQYAKCLECGMTRLLDRLNSPLPATPEPSTRAV